MSADIRLKTARGVAIVVQGSSIGGDTVSFLQINEAAGSYAAEWLTATETRAVIAALQATLPAEEAPAVDSKPAVKVGSRIKVLRAAAIVPGAVEPGALATVTGLDDVTGQPGRIVVRLDEAWMRTGEGHYIYADSWEMGTDEAPGAPAPAFEVGDRVSGYGGCEGVITEIGPRYPASAGDCAVEWDTGTLARYGELGSTLAKLTKIEDAEEPTHAGTATVRVDVRLFLGDRDITNLINPDALEG